MKVSGVEPYRYELPFREPPKLKGEVLKVRRGFLLRLTDAAGREGWGEAAPLPGFSPETLEEAGAQLRKVGGSLAEGSGSDLPEDLYRGRFGAGLAPSVRFAVELAALELEAAASGGSVVERILRLSGEEEKVFGPEEVVPVCALASGSPEDVLGKVRRAKEAGYRAVKIKLGTFPVEREAALVAQAAQTLGPEVSLRLDANRGWSFEEAARFARLAEGSAFEYVEEPLAEPERLAELSSAHNLPVALDESLVGMAPEEVAEHSYAAALVLKPTLLGGVRRTLRFAEAGRPVGLKPVVSSAYESGVATRALAALAFATGGGKVAAGLDTHGRLAGDVLRAWFGGPEILLEKIAGGAPDPDRLVRVV